MARVRTVAQLVTVMKLLTLTTAYPSGAPDSACFTMMPNHGVIPQMSTPPYDIIVSSPSLRAGQSLSVTVKGINNSGRTFRGFLLEARSNNVSIGTFSSLPSQAQLVCSNSAVTHTSRSDKTNVTVEWNPPTDYSGGVTFVATVVEFKEQFWTNLAIAALVEFTQTITPPTTTQSHCSSVETTECKLDLALVVDCSGSIRDSNIGGDDNWQLIISLMSNIVNGLNVSANGTHVGVVSFGNEAMIHFYLNNDTDAASLSAAVQSIPYFGGNTNTTGGLRTMRTQVFNVHHGDRLDVPNVCILITDGVPTREVEGLPYEIQLVRNAGIRCLGIGVTIAVNETILKSIVTYPDQDYFYVTDFNQFAAILDRLISQTCRKVDCSVSTTPVPTSTPTTTQSHCSSVETTECKLDLALVADCSGSIGYNNWQLIINLMSNIVNGLNVSVNGTHVGVVSFGNEAMIHFYLNNDTDAASLSAAVQSIPYFGGDTNTTGGLRTMRTQVFNVDHGDRLDVPNVCILITDGVPSREVEGLPYEIQLVRNAGIRCLCIGVTHDVNETILNTIAPCPDQDYFYVTDFRQFAAILDSLIRLIRQTCRKVDCSVSTTPVPTSTPTTTTTSAPTTTTTPAPPPTTTQCIGGGSSGNIADCTLDIAIIIDCSGSIRDSNPPGVDNWQLVLNFVNDIVNGLKISPTGTHVSVATFGNDATVHFYLYNYTDASSLSAAIRALLTAYCGGNTNTTGGLRVMRTQIFTPDHGDRPDVPNVGILITDGVPTREVEGLANEVQLDRNAGIRILGIGVTNQVNETILRSIVTFPDRDYFYVSDFSQFTAAVLTIINTTCRQVDCPTTPAPPTPVPVPTTRTVPCIGSGGDCKLDIAILVDSSGSIRDSNPPGVDNWQLVKNFMSDIVTNLPISPNGTRVCVIIFANDARVLFYPNNYTDSGSLSDAIQNMEYLGGNTNITGALRVMRNICFGPRPPWPWPPPPGPPWIYDRPDIPNIGILITDGVPTREVEGLANEVQLDRDAGIRVLCIGVTNQVNETILKSIVTYPDQDYFYVTDFSQFSVILNRLISQTCRKVDCGVPTVTIPTSSSPVTTPTTTRTTIPAISTLTTTPVLLPPANCTVLADVILVLDASGSIGPSDYELMKIFVSQLILGFDVDSGNVRVGLVTFSSAVEPRFNLSSYSRRSALMSAVAALTYTAGTTNTSSALNYVRSVMLTSAAGDRTDVPNVVVVMTDGGSNDPIATQREADLLRRLTVSGPPTMIISLSIGDWTNMNELNNIASWPYQQNEINVPNYSALPGVESRLRSAICGSANLCYPNPCQNGAQCIGIQKTYTCLCPTGFAGQNCDQSCNGADVVFVVSASGIMGWPNFQLVLDFIRQLVYGLNLNKKDSQVALVMYANDSAVRFYLNDFNNFPVTSQYPYDYAFTQLHVLNAISQYYPNGRSNLAAALRKMRDDVFTAGRGARSGTPKICVVLTATPSYNETETVLEAMAARNNLGVQIIGIGVGGAVSRSEMEGVVSYPTASNAFYVSDFAQLGSILNNITSSQCNRVNECNSGSCLNGGTCKDLINGFTCSCTSSWTGKYCERAGSGRLDVNIVIDVSGSIRNERLPLVLSFVNRLIDGLEISSDKTRVGVAYYSDFANALFYMNAYYAKQDVMYWTKRARYMGGRTNTAAALQLLLSSMFTTSNGGRSDAQDVAIIYSDGRSTINSALTIPTAIQLRLAGTIVLAFGIGTDIGWNELNAIASPPANRTVFIVTSVTQLENIRTSLLASTANGVNECASNPCMNGATCVDGYFYYKCICASGYTGTQCMRQCSRLMDVALILDRADYMDTGPSSWVVSIARQIVAGLPVGSGSARVAVITYADNATVSFNLGDYTNTDDMRSAMTYGYMGSKSRLQQALRILPSSVFNTARSGVARVTIVLTDGWATPSDPASVVDLANAARTAITGLEIYVVGIGPDAAFYDSNINGMASGPNYVSYVTSAGQVDSAADNVLGKICV